MKSAGSSTKVPGFLTKALVEPIEGVSLKRAAWAYGVAKTGSSQEAVLYTRLVLVATRELGLAGAAK